MRRWIESRRVTAVLAVLAVVLLVAVRVVVAEGGPFYPGPTPLWNCGGHMYPNGSCGPLPTPYHVP